MVYKFPKYNSENRVLRVCFWSDCKTGSGAEAESNTLATRYVFINFLNSLLLVLGMARAGVGAGVGPGLRVQKKTSEVRRELMLLVKAPDGVLASSLLLELTNRRL